MSNGVEPFVQNANSPNLDQAIEGVAINVQPMLSNSSELVLHGVCRASEETAGNLVDTILHNVAFICTCGQNLMPVAFPLVRDQVVFPEDILREGDNCTAYFNVILSECGIPYGQGQYYMLASFHSFLSEVIEFKLGDNHG